MLRTTILPASFSSETDGLTNAPPLLARHSVSNPSSFITIKSQSTESKQPCQFLYLLEYCPNLEIITFTLSLNEVSSKAISSAAPLNDKEVLSLLTITSESITFFDLMVRFPVPVDTRSMRESWNEFDLSLRFHKKHEPSTLRSSRTLRSTEIDSTRFWNLPWIANATAIGCAHCRKKLSTDFDQNKPSIPAQNKLFKGTFLVPGSHWQELVECWACHEQSIVMPHLHASPTFKEGFCGVGPSYLIISEKQGEKWYLKLDLDDSKSRIQCKNCCTKLGEVSYQGKTQVWKLYKTNLLVHIRELSWNMSKVAHACLAAELLELHHPFACLPSSIDSNQHLYLWVLNWNTTVKTNETSSPQSVKLLYQLESNQEMHLPTLLHFDPQCLYDSLERLNSQLPMTRRSVSIKGKKWNVAYLMV